MKQMAQGDFLIWSVYCWLFDADGLESLTRTHMFHISCFPVVVFRQNKSLCTVNVRIDCKISRILNAWYLQVLSPPES